MGEDIKPGNRAGGGRGDLGSLGIVGRRLAERRSAERRSAERRFAERRGSGPPHSADSRNQLAALEESNIRLEEFASAAAHDLSEGLATIGMFAETLESRLGYRLEPATLRDLNGIRAGLERMNLLVNEELKTARVGNRYFPVDSEVAVREALSNLAARLARTPSDIVVEPLPWVVGDAAELTRLFQNLLANSLASRRPERDLRIRMRARRVGLRWRFEIEDTGCGISPQAAAVLESTVRGTVPERGLGLVICRRIVEAHGGSIRAARMGGGGTVVSFDLPAPLVSAK